MVELLATEEKMVSQAALEVLDRFRIREFADALEEFLSRYPKYVKYRAELIRESELAIAACGVAACCRSYGEIPEPEDIAACVESALRKANEDRPGKGRKGTCKPIPTRSEVVDYLRVFLYVIKNARRLCRDEESCIQTSLRSVAYLLISNAIKGNASIDEEFGDTVHLLDEIVFPILTTTFSELSIAREIQPFYSPDLDQELFGTETPE